MANALGNPIHNGPIHNDPIHKASLQSRMEEMATLGYIVTLEDYTVNVHRGLYVRDSSICFAARRPDPRAAWTVPQCPVVSVCSPAK
jgi:hypothetical protein